MHALVYLLHITQIGTMYILTLWSGIIVHGRLALQRVIGPACTVPNKPRRLANFHIFKKLPNQNAIKFEFY